MQQALFSPGPSSCPAGPLPRVTALDRVLFCFCLDTLAKISVRAEGGDRVRRRLEAHPPHTHSACPFLNTGGFAGRKRSLGTWVPSTYMGGAGLRLSSLGVWPPGSFPKLQLTGVGVYEGGSEEAGGAHRGDEESAGAGEGWVSAFLPLPAEASGVGWRCLLNGGRDATFEDSFKGQLNIGGVQGRGLQEEQPIVF